jgi:hypothetical protein
MWYCLSVYIVFSVTQQIGVTTMQKHLGKIPLLLSYLASMTLRYEHCLCDNSCILFALDDSAMMNDTKLKTPPLHFFHCSITMVATLSVNVTCESKYLEYSFPHAVITWQCCSEGMHCIYHCPQYDTADLQ